MTMNSVITGKTRIMVVDDDKEIREVISVLLTNENFDVIEAGAGEDAMKLMTANIDLIILDVTMPGISGYQVSRMIRESSNVPILFLTARTQSSDLVLGYSSGGQIAGVFGDAEKGWQKYNVPKPGALLLAYPINNFWLAKPAYTALLDVDDWMQKHYYDYTLSKLIAPDYPPVFLWYGKCDRILKLFGFDQQGPALQSALEIDGVPHEEKVYEDAGHGIGIGLGTEAEGWLNAAVAFWKKVT